MLLIMSRVIKVSVSVSKYLACKGMKENDKEETKQRKAKDIIDTLDIDMDALNIGNHQKYLNRQNKWQAVAKTIKKIARMSKIAKKWGIIAKMLQKIPKK